MTKAHIWTSLAQPEDVGANNRQIGDLVRFLQRPRIATFIQIKKQFRQMQDKAVTILHASCVAFENRGLLILGASGSGKSTLALSLMALGAGLVADDRTIVSDGLMASCPDAIRGRIEARGVGILAAIPAAPVRLVLAVDLDRAEPERLPPHRKVDLLGQSLPLVLGQGRVHLASVLLQYLRAGRADRDDT